MKKFILIILSCFLAFINTVVSANSNIVIKDIKAISSDGFNINAKLSYPKISSKTEFATVVLLHSLGYNSDWWDDLPVELYNKGYAVLAIDLRGHGESVYNSKLTKVSWKNLSDSAYAKYSDDVLAVMNQVNAENSKRKFFNNWALVGADIGASAGVLASEKYAIQPKTIVMLSPVVKTRGLYIPISMANLDNTDFLSISSTDDMMSKKAEHYLSKFAQNEFTTYTSESKTNGMLMLKNDKELGKVITEWISQYLD